MKDFFHRYSYSIVKMFINQFAISIFGTMLSMATNATNNDTFTLVVSIFSIVFYLFLIYTMIWEVGAKDKISVDVGKKPYRPLTGLYMGLIANAPNLLFALIYAIGYPFMGTHVWAGTMNAIVKLYTVICEGMYLGVTAVLPFGSAVKLNYQWWTYFLITVPAIATATLAYYIGHKDFRFFAFLASKKKAAGSDKR